MEWKDASGSECFSADFKPKKWRRAFALFPHDCSVTLCPNNYWLRKMNRTWIRWAWMWERMWYCDEHSKHWGDQ